MAAKQNQNNSKAKLKFENYSPGKKLKDGEQIAVFGNKGIKLLGVNQLLPPDTGGSVALTVFGRTLKETFTTQYGYGNDPIAGRFAFSGTNALWSNWFGWILERMQGRDAFLDFNIYMGAWVSAEQGPLSYMLLGIDLFIATGQPVFTVSINGAEVDYAYNTFGDKRIMVWVRRPATGTSQAQVSLKLKFSNNAANTGIWVRRVERYDSIFLPPWNNEGELETL